MEQVKVDKVDIVKKASDKYLKKLLIERFIKDEKDRAESKKVR